ncbi:MAG TPA: hypothetical protein GYA10_12040 [Alphaproteobacteria bacterium]|nr:hypothetical protein [Alphaproteobacteria bacterium]
MAPVIVNPDHVREFKDADSFHRWLGEHHASAPEVWIKIHKVGSGKPSITARDAIDVALCWGWIDGIRKGFDDKSFLQRYTRRGRRSIWSRINVENVERLLREGRMTEAGLREVQAAKADGRWDRAYASGGKLETPPDLLDAIRAEPEALATYATLNATNRYALAFRLHHMRTEAGRQKKIADFVAMLKRGATIYPQSAKRAAKKAAE